MANAQKYTRGQKEDGLYFLFGNQDIDTSKSHLNYNLAPEHDGGQLSFINRRTSEVQCLKRTDVNVMCSRVVTAPKDLTKDGYDLFFREVYKFLNDRYADGSDKSVISAYVHMDEISPHLHYAFVPVVHDEKKALIRYRLRQLLTALICKHSMWIQRSVWRKSLGVKLAY